MMKIICIKINQEVTKHEVGKDWIVLFSDAVADAASVLC